MLIALKMDPKDTVAVVTQDVKAGQAVQIGQESVVANQDINAGHKIAVVDGKSGDMVYKYGKVIGQLSADVKVGDWVHTHNVLDITDELSQEYMKNYRARGK